MTQKVLAVAAAILAAATLSSAQPGGAARPATAVTDRDARAIEAMLVAPCCFTQQVSVHQSQAADEVRRDVRERLANGQSREAIIALYVSRYGKRILAEPPAAGFDLTLYVMPIVLFAATIAVVAFVIRRSVHHQVADAPLDRFAATAAENARLDDELRDLD